MDLPGHKRGQKPETMKVVLLLGFLVGTACSCYAEPLPQDITLRDGRVLKGAVIKNRDPAYITFAFEDGIQRVPIASLSTESFKALGISYNPREAIDFVKQQQSQAREAALARARANIAQNIARKMVEIRGVFMSETENGVLISMEVGRYETEIVHVVGNFGKPLSNQEIRTKGLETGTYEYFTVLGARNRVRQFTSDIPTLVEMVMTGELPGYKELSRPPAPAHGAR